ncbi:MAG: peptidylprolyl isomerase, partial [Paracoccaceae bacterium]
MIKKVLTILAALIVLGVLYFAFNILTQPDPPVVPPVPPAPTSSVQTTTGETATASTSPAQPTAPPATDGARGHDILVIEVAGSTTGTIEIELLNDIAPRHVARIVALAKAGKYDNIVFHRVIEGFMAQTGDVQYGLHGGDTLKNAGMGGSDMPDLEAEFSDEPFVAGIVGMARASNVDSANSQFFIMFGEAPYLDGQYTVVGRVVAGQEVVNAIRKGDPARNGTV